MKFITLDFETYYAKDYSLSKKDCTTQSYIDDERFEVIGVCVMEDGVPPHWFSGTHRDTGYFLQAFDWDHAALIAHNALFDASILAWRFGIYPKLIIDTLSMARAVHGSEVGNSLAKLVTHYGLGEKGFEVHDAKGKRRRDFSPGELCAYGSYCKNDVVLTRKLFDALAVHFTRKEIKLIDMTIRMHTEPQFNLDRVLLKGHLLDVQEKKEQLLAEAGVSKDDLMSNPKLAAVLESWGVPVPMKTSLKTGKQAFAFAKTDTEFTALLEHPDLRVQTAVAARLGVKSTLEETRTERFIKIAEDHGSLPIPLKYGDTLTHRWAGADSINLQNIPRGSVIKQGIKAPTGFKIVGADLSAIELRTGLYFAGQMDKVELIAQGVGLYEEFAAEAFRVLYVDVTSDQRFVGKCSQLSLIYGTGHIKLRNTILNQSGALKLDIGLDEAKRLTDLYRSAYTHVVASWRDAGRALNALYEDAFCTVGLGQLKLDVIPGKGIRMPSGLFMRYPGLRKQMNDEGRDEWVYNTQKGLRRLYGAKVMQNINQGIARCVMGEAMVKVQKKYPIGLTIHDALYVIVPEADAEDVRRELIMILREPPKWLPGIPLDAEAGFGDNLAFKMWKY